jgi:hypothetical protein
MFNLFKSKSDSPAVKDIIWMNRNAKWKAIIDEWKKDPSLIIICWFNNTLRELEALFAAESIPASLFIAAQVHSSQISGKRLIFAEHYPIVTKEQELFRSLGLSEVIVHSSLDEPLFDHFGGDRIAQMMKQMGMKETESASHKMISQAIVNAQEKIGKKVMVEQMANSQKEWIERNLQ